MSPWTERLIADTVAKSPWLSTPYQRARANICRALKIDRDEPAAIYATLPFVVLDFEGTSWIAGQTNPPPMFSPMRHDLGDVILWQPNTGKLRVLGEAANASILIAPTVGQSELTVFADGFAFFRAWANRRAEFLERRRTAKANVHANVPTEPADGCLPGALIIGKPEQIHWRDAGADVLVAGPGIDPKTLQRAVFRSARLPRISGMGLAA